MEVYVQYCIALGATVLGIVAVKGVSLFLRLYEFKINPDSRKRANNLPEGVFRQLRNKQVVIKLKSGAVLTDCKYVKTIFFAEGDFAINTNVFFQFEKSDANLLFIGGLDILSIETIEKS